MATTQQGQQSGQNASITNISNKTTNEVSQHIDQMVNNTVINFSSVEGAIESVTALTEKLNNCSFDKFATNIINLRDMMIDFRQSISTTTAQVTILNKNTSTDNSTKQSGQIQQVTQQITQSQTIDNSVNVDLSSADKAVANFGDVVTNVGVAVDSVSGVFVSLKAAIQAVGEVFVNITGSIKAVGEVFISIGESIKIATSGIADIINAIANLILAVAALFNSMMTMAQACQLLVTVLPALGTAIITMAQNMSGLLAFLPELIIFIVFMGLLALMGEGLLMAGQGISLIAQGLMGMAEGFAAVIEFLPIFIASLSCITDNVAGIILFVLLAAAMFLMAIAMEKMNEHFSVFVGHLEKMHSLMSVGFVAAFVVFGLMLIGMSFFMDKVASGIQKITNAMDKQITKLAILNPLLAAKAILENWIMGSITVALAIAGALAVKFAVPAMATGGVVGAPTMALLGEGRYPEAVVPLGDSPQFSSMKTDIANAVLQGMMAMNGAGAKAGASSGEIVLNIDGTKLARVILPNIDKEISRGNYALNVREG